MSGSDIIDPVLLTSCTVSSCPIDTSFYNYRLSLAANVVFLVLFACAIPVYLGIWLYTRRCHFFTLVMLLGLVTEVLGYGARIWSFYNQWEENPYLMQIICLTLAPAFFSAGIYVCLSRIVLIYGRENSRIPPAWYTLIFIPCDAIALILQAVGGGIAAVSLNNEDLNGINTGDDIMTAGLSWQVFTLFCFLGLCVDFFFRVRRRCHRLGDTTALSQDASSIAVRQSKLFRGFLVALGIATMLIFWRCVYRVAELNDGFTGPITYKQGLFVGFEGVLIVVAVVVLEVMHPAICMAAVVRRGREDKDAEAGAAVEEAGIPDDLVGSAPRKSDAGTQQEVALNADPEKDEVYNPLKEEMG